MKDNIKSFDTYNRQNTLELLNKLKNNDINIKNLKDIQIDNLISYYSYSIKMNKEKIKKLRKEVKDL